MKKKVLSLFMAFAIVISLLPASALADSGIYGDTNRNEKVDVTLTISEGTQGFYKTATGEQLILRELSVPYFDLALYDLEEYYYNPNCYADNTQIAGNADMAEGVVTTMHVFIYATEVYMCGIDPKNAGQGLGAAYIAGYGKPRKDGQYLSWTGGVGSSFMTFWNDSTNLNYFLDYKYPLGAPGWGSTSDQQALQDGVAIEVHLIDDPNVFGSQYGYFTNPDGVIDKGSVKEDSPLELTLYESNSWYGGSREPSLRSNTTVYFINENEYDGEAISEWTKIGNTDANGKIEIPASLKAGTYYIGALGKVVGGSELAPAVYRLTVKEARAVELYGDADGDGSVTAKDATLVLQAVAQKQVRIDSEAADVDGDGILTAKDATCILRYVAKTIPIFPVEETIN